MIFMVQVHTLYIRTSGFCFAMGFPTFSQRPSNESAQNGDNFTGDCTGRVGWAQSIPAIGVPTDCKPNQSKPAIESLACATVPEWPEIPEDLYNRYINPQGSATTCAPRWPAFLGWKRSLE